MRGFGGAPPKNMARLPRRRATIGANGCRERRDRFRCGVAAYIPPAVSAGRDREIRFPMGASPALLLNLKIRRG